MRQQQTIPGWEQRSQLRLEGQRLRGELLDAFARLEIAVLVKLERLGGKACASAPFGQKLAAVREAVRETTDEKRIAVLVEKAAPLAAQRADIVHSIMSVMPSDDGEGVRWLLLFQNCGDPERPPLALTKQQLKALIARLKQLANEFSQQPLKAPTPTAPASPTG